MRIFLRVKTIVKIFIVRVINNVARNDNKYSKTQLRL